MRLGNNFIYIICMVLSLSFASGVYALPAGRAINSGMISTSAVVSDLSRNRDRAKVEAFLSRDEVKNELIRFGVEPSEASQRLASLSDQEIEKMAGQIDEAPAGGEVLIISLTTILLVVLILILLGKI